MKFDVSAEQLRELVDEALLIYKIPRTPDMRDVARLIAGYTITALEHSLARSAPNHVHGWADHASFGHEWRVCIGCGKQEDR